MDLLNPFERPSDQAASLLAAYAAAIDAHEPDENGDRAPAERLGDFDGLEEQPLAELHGELLAGGWIDFVFGGRGALASYVVTPSGRSCLGGPRAADDDENTLAAAA
ncbi:MAG: hypothetical protein AAF532_15270 [Planctomycetota bacterium]